MKRAITGGLIAAAALGAVVFTPSEPQLSRNAEDGFYAFASVEEAASYAAEVDSALGYPMPGVPAQPYPKGWTLTFSEPHLVDGTWYVQAHPGVKADAKHVDELPAAGLPAAGLPELK